MREQEPHKETIGKGELFYLWHPGTDGVFAGYGLTMLSGRNDLLIGLLMIDRPRPVDPEWLAAVEVTFGKYQLAIMTANGDRGIACQLQIEPNSLSYLRRLPTDAKTEAITDVLKPFKNGHVSPGSHPRMMPSLLEIVRFKMGQSG